MPFLTPDAIPVLTKCKRIRIPDHPLIWGAVNGAMLELTKKFNWEKYGAIEAADMAEIMWPFVDEFLQDEFCEEGTPDEGECTEFTPDAPFIQYSPNDPFQTPDVVPPGYVIPPFYNNPLIPLPGVLPGDAMVNFASLPIFQNLPDLLETGLPRIRVNFEGTGQVELELVRVPQGGQVLITHDDNPLTAKVVDLNALDITGLETIFDLLNIVFQGSVNSVEVVEVEFDTPGDHFIDITFLPAISEDVILGFGGGLRRVSLCGVDIQGDEVMPQFRTIDDGCTLQWRPNPSAAWQTLSTELCGEDGEDGTDATIDVNNYRVNNCVLEVNAAGGWTPIPGASWYPLNGGCPADFFYARSSLPYLLGQLGDNADVFRLGLLANNDVEWKSFNRRMVLRYGGASALDRITLYTDGHVGISRADQNSPTVWGKLAVDNDLGTNHVIRAQAASAQTAAVLKLFLVGGSTAKQIETQRGTLLHQAWNFDGVSEQTNDLVFLDYSNTSNNRLEVGRIRNRRENPAVAQYHGAMEFRVRDFVNEKLALSIGTDAAGALPTIGVLGATRLPRQTIAGDLQGYQPLKDLISALAGFGWVTDNTTLGVPPEPEPEEDTRRCNAAWGAIEYLVDAMYLGSTIIYSELHPTDPSDAIVDRFPFYNGPLSEDQLSDWATAVFAEWGSDSVEIAEHAARVSGVKDELKQFLYCALDDCGTLSFPGMTDFYANVENDTTLGATDAEIFHLWIQAFVEPSWANIIAFGLNFSCPDDCEWVTDCETPPDWAMSWQFANNSGSGEWAITNGTYFSGTGWRHNSLASPLVMEFNNHTSGVIATFNCNIGDAVQLSIYDDTTNVLLAQSGGLGQASSYELSWQSPSPSADAVNGIRLELDTVDLVSGDNFTNARVLIVCVEGRNTAPIGGNTLTHCFD